MIQKMIDIRVDHDESQRDLAKAIGYHQVQIARYETGRNTPPIEYLIRFCRHYHVSADYILDLGRDMDWPR
ncbi:MAG: helix-turn-helix transcriptional regulator [Oscillospiraceae bacterium]|nr:helix-turn-helix transcriptional regulator [Oscillospiraceae bacterium]